MSFVGVDACRKGWAAVVLDDDAPPRGVIIEQLDQLDAIVPDVQDCAVDIPIALPGSGRRKRTFEPRSSLAHVGTPYISPGTPPKRTPRPNGPLLFLGTSHRTRPHPIGLDTRPP